MKPKSAAKKFDFRTLLTISLALIVLTSPLLYLTVERTSSNLLLKSERSKLAAANLTRPHREIVPPPDPAAVQNGEKLIAAIDGLRAISRNYPDLASGIQLMRQTGPGVAAPAFREPAPILYTTKPPNPPLSWQDLRAQMGKADSILAEARQILEAPIAQYIKYDTVHDFADRGQQQALCSMLQTKSILDLQEGEIGAAIGNLEAISKVAAKEGRTGSSVNSVIETGYWTFAILKPIWEILQSPQLSEADLQRIQQLLSQADFVATILVALEADLCRTPLYHADILNSKKPGNALQMVDSTSGFLAREWMIKIRDELWPLVWVDGDLARILRSQRDSIMLAREFSSTRNWIAIQARLNQPESSAFDKWRFPIQAAIDGGAGKLFLEPAARGQIQLELARAATALARYKLANSSYPETLADLVPQFLPHLPHDWYDGLPLKYRRLEDGRYLLYSVGKDGQDGGGSSSDHSLLSGRDILWPHAAKR